MQNLTDFIENNDIELISIAEQSGGVFGYTFSDVYDLAIVNNCTNVSYITAETVGHIFRGSNNSGVHHISALIADPDTYKIHNRVEIPNSGGCYRAKIRKNGVEMSSAHPEGKTFFPDSWSEGKIITAIKEAYGSATFIDGSTNSYIGTGQGLDILFYKATDGRVISAFPNY